MYWWFSMERKEKNILNSVKEALGFSHYTPFISKAFLKANLKASIYMSLVIMTLESWMMVMVYQIYKLAFEDHRLDRASAEGFIFFLILLAFTAITMKWSDRNVSYDA